MGSTRSSTRSGCLVSSQKGTRIALYRELGLRRLPRARRKLVPHLLNFADDKHNVIVVPLKQRRNTTSLPLAELWWEARCWFETKDCFISDSIPEALIEKFVEECSEPAFKDHSSGKTDVESKRDMKLRGISSPNLADAFCMTLAEDGAIMNGAGSDVQWNKPLGYKYKAVA